MATTFRDYYEVLGVPRTATEDDVKQAYRRLARQHHPDLHPQAEKDVHTKKMQEINEAYSVLGSKENRAKYDQLGPRWQEGPAPEPPPSSRGRGSPPRWESSGGDAEGFSDFFRSMFGGGQEPFSTEDVPPSTLDIEAELDLPLVDAVKGVEREFRLTATGLCPVCQGTGRVNKKMCPRCGGLGEIQTERTVKARIPAGLQNGSRIRLKGQGNEGPAGQPRGDLYLRIHLRPDPRFTVEGANLEMEIRLMPWQAALGAEVSVGTLDGPVRIRIPRGTQTGQRLRLAGKGLGKGGTSRGDLFVRVEITIPSKISTKAEALYKQLQEEADEKN